MTTMNTSPVINNVPTNNIAHRPDSSNLRGRVVEILSGTANGCLTELGYYPGMPQKLLELERTNAQWQQENVKLFQDNRSLARALQAQSERFKLITGPELQRLDAMRTLEHKVQALVDERSTLLKQNEALMANQPHNAEYGRLYAEFAKLSTTYGAALNEISQLRNYIEALTQGQYTVPSPMVQQVTSGNTFQQAPGRQSSEAMKIAQSQMVPHTRRPSAAYPSQNRPASQQGGHPQATSSALVPSISRNSMRPFVQYQRPISAPSFIPSNQPSHNHHPPLSIQTSPFVTPNHQTLHLPPTPMSAVHHSQVTTPQDASNPTVVPSPTNSSIPTDGSLPTASVNTLQQWSQDQAQPQITSDRVYTALSRIPTPVETPVDSLTKVPEASTSSLVAVTTTSPTGSPSQPPDVTTVSSPRPGSSKRGSIDMFDVQVTEDQQHKKQKLDAPDSTIERATSRDPTPDTNDITKADDMDVDQESDDGVVEIGPDGLRLEEDCLLALIEDDEEDDTLQTCMLCKARYDMKYTTDPPQVFIKATKEELIQHCSTEHHDAWETLRRNV